MQSIESCCEFSLLIGQLVRRLHLLDRDQKVCCSVTIPQSYTIETLSLRGMLTMNELSLEMGVAVSTMTRIINLLVRDGIARRKSNSRDRRQVCIELTVKGKELAGRLKDCCEGYSREVLEQVPEDKRDEVIKSLELLSTAITSVQQACRTNLD